MITNAMMTQMINVIQDYLTIQWNAEIFQSITVINVANSNLFHIT